MDFKPVHVSPDLERLKMVSKSVLRPQLLGLRAADPKGEQGGSKPV